MCVWKIMSLHKIIKYKLSIILLYWIPVKI